ncbi:unnamed protein product [Heligmosomoides polygyrus]|uniref:Uncharacterized protein n=1 Tax=Heligmosomoides polygyrus TaxID=6339 RepID=A0A183FYV3_HELPZ|nr:unnamed protein product [Heligmosomoides polygyrus]
MDRKTTVIWWRNYFKEILTVEFAHSAIPSASPVYGSFQKISVRETKAASRKMMPGKATGPDDLATDLWKSKSWYPAEWMTMLFNQVVVEKKASNNQRRSPASPSPTLECAGHARLAGFAGNQG